jgi:hypothetical protein
VDDLEGAQEGMHVMAESQSSGPGTESRSPGPGKSTADAAVNELKKQIAQRNEAAHKEWRKRRDAREKAKLADLRKWQQL